MTWSGISALMRMFWEGISICRVLAMHRESRAYRVSYGVLLSYLLSMRKTPFHSAPLFFKRGNPSLFFEYKSKFNRE